MQNGNQRHPRAQPTTPGRAYWRWTDLKWKRVLWPDESTFLIAIDHRVLQAEEKKDYPDCYQVQKPRSMMV